MLLCVPLVVLTLVGFSGVWFVCWCWLVFWFRVWFGVVDLVLAGLFRFALWGVAVRVCGFGVWWMDVLVADAFGFCVFLVV